MKKVRFEINGKDPDLWNQFDDEAAVEFSRFLEFGEYYVATVELDPATGKGTIQFKEQ